MSAWKWSEIRQEWRTVTGTSITREELAAAGIEARPPARKFERPDAIALLGLAILFGLVIAWRFSRMAKDVHDDPPPPLPRARVVRR